MTIELPDGLPPLIELAIDAHKGDAGRLLIVGGSRGLTGAVALCQAAALRVGAGLVTCAVPDRVADILEVKTTEAMTLALPDTADGSVRADAVDALEEILDRSDAVVLGPGLGRSDDATKFVTALLARASAIPTVVDADALWHVSQLGRDEPLAPSDLRVWTPHAGELARLLDARTSGDASIDDLLTRLGGVLVEKKAGTEVHGPTGRWRCAAGNPGLASGGTGDVLAGVIGGLLARGHAPESAARLGTWLHGRAADYAAYGAAAETNVGRPPDRVPRSGEPYRGLFPRGEAGLLARDVIAALPLATLERHSAQPTAGE